MSYEMAIGRPDGASLGNQTYAEKKKTPPARKGRDGEERSWS